MTSRLYKDPVVAEVHAIRDKMVAKLGGDHRKLMERIREHQRATARRIIPAPPASQDAQSNGETAGDE